MTTYVLVHGAWSGAHGFTKVRRLLHADGHEVFTPSLTGIGERSHLTSPQVGLHVHVQDVANAILYEDLSDIVLLGFSYGGMVVTGALEHVADRVSHLVYLDAFVPSDGDSISSLVGGALGGGDTVALGRPWLVPPMPRVYADPADEAWMTARRVDHPARCFSETVRLTTPLEDHPFTRTYIKATADPAEQQGSAFWQAAARATASSSWSYHEVACDHLVPTNRPHELAALLTALGVTPSAGRAAPNRTVRCVRC